MEVGHWGGTKRMRRAAIAVIGAGVALGCAARTPRIAGKPGAPTAPNRLWEPPPSAERPDSLRPAVMPAGLAERAASLNAVFEAETRPGEGTVIRVVVPPATAGR